MSAYHKAQTDRILNAIAPGATYKIKLTADWTDQGSDRYAETNWMTIDLFAFLNIAARLRRLDEDGQS